MCKNKMCQHLTLDSYGWHKPCDIGKVLNDSTRNAFIPASPKGDYQFDENPSQPSQRPIHQVGEAHSSFKF